MRDMLFGILLSPFRIYGCNFCRTIIFIIGLGFIAGFILHRDRKRNKVQERFKKQ
ncbi:DUF2627 family protein [Bacillus sp. N9]